MKVVIASDSYKGSCSAVEVANSIEKGFKRVFKGSEIIKIPVADGGEGTVEAIVIGTNGRYVEADAIGPLGEKIKAKYGIVYENIAVIEMAAASGISLLEKNELNPLLTTTYGTGQQIKDAMEKGIRKIYVGLGGSCTNDGGVGMAQALGVTFKDETGVEVGFGGGELSKISSIDISNINPLLKETEIVIISDVTNPLYGPKGASCIYGPQKGATEEMVKTLDDNLKHLGKAIEENLNIKVSDIPGSGAAGGLGAGLLAFCNAKIESGIDKVLDITNIDAHLKDADLVITGEGKIDGQSIYGKVPVGVAKRANRYNVPVIAIVGSIGEGAKEVYSHGIDGIIDIVNRPMPLEDAIENSKTLIEDAAETVARILKINIKSTIPR